MELLYQPIMTDDAHQVRNFLSAEKMPYGEILAPLGFTHIQTWFTLTEKNIYQHPSKGIKLFISGHGDDCVIFFDTIDLAEEAYMKVRRIDGCYRLKLNTISFPFLRVLLKEFLNFIQ